MQEQENKSLFYQQFGFEVQRQQISADQLLSLVAETPLDEQTGKKNLMEAVKNKFATSDSDVMTPNLSELVIVDADLANVDFSGCIISGARFNNCNLAYSVLRDLDLGGVVFFDCMMVGVDLRGSDISDCTFSGYSENWLSKKERCKKLEKIQLSSARVLIEKYLKENERLVKAAQERAVMEHHEQIIETEFKIKSLKKSQNIIEKLLMFFTRKSSNEELLYAIKKLNKLNEKTPTLDTENIILSLTLRYVLESGAEFDNAYQKGGALEGINIKNIYVRLSKEQLEEFQRGQAKYSNLVQYALEQYESAGEKLGDGEQIIPDFSIFTDEKGDIVKTDLSGMNFSNTDLSRANFLGCNLAGCKFNRTVLHHATFEGACLDGAEFTASTGDGINFTAVKADEITISVCAFNSAHFGSAEISNAKILDTSLPFASGVNSVFANSNFVKVKAKNSNLQNAKLLKCKFDHVELVRSKLDKISFKGSILVNCIFNESSLAKGDLSRCKFQDTSFVHVNAPDSRFEDILAKGRLDFNRAFLGRASFNRARGEWYDFTDSQSFLVAAISAKIMRLTLSNANFSFAVLQNSQFKKFEAVNTNLTGSVLSNSKLLESNMQGATLNDVKADGLHAKNTVMNNVEMHGCSFVGAILEGAKMTDSDLRNGLFSQAKLSGANLNGCFINYATDFSRSDIVKTTGALKFADQNKQIQIEVYKKQCDDVGASSPTNSSDRAREQFLGIIQEMLNKVGRFFITPLSERWVMIFLAIISGILSIDYFSTKYSDESGIRILINIAGKSAVVIVIILIASKILLKHIQKLTVGTNKLLAIILTPFYGLPGIVIGLLLSYSTNEIVRHYREKDLNEYFSIMFLKLASTCAYLAKGLSLNKKYTSFVNKRLNDMRGYRKASRVKYKNKQASDVVDISELSFRRLVAKAGLEENSL